MRRSWGVIRSTLVLLALIVYGIHVATYRWPMRWNKDPLTSSTIPKIYVYPLPGNETAELIDYQWASGWLQDIEHQYQGDIQVYNFLINSPWRTYNPDEATLFYIPILPTRLLHQEMDLGANWDQAAHKSGEYIETTLNYVRQHPYWERFNGRDHFTMLADDMGRCYHFKYLEPVIWGDMFTIQNHGDLVQRDYINHSWPCYDPEKDILLPVHTPLNTIGLADVFGHKRPITLLYRFGNSESTAANPYHGIHVRNELILQHKQAPVPGSDWSVKSVNETMNDMANSVFCVCPPGVSAFTGRFWYAIRRGCIPVTFFRAYALPFQDLGIDFNSFTVNIQPNNIKDLSSRLGLLQQKKEDVQRLQKNLERVQRLFIWDHAGVFSLLSKAIQKRNDDILLWRKLQNSH